MLEIAPHGAQWLLGAAGDSFNTALYLARLGSQVRYLTALGVDSFSAEMLANWRDEGIDTSLVLRDPERLPGLYAIRTDARGERSFYYWRQHSAARNLFRLPGIEGALAAAADCDLLYLTGITLSLFEPEERQACMELARNVRQRGGRVAFDPNYRPQGWSSVGAARDAIVGIASQVDFLLTTDTDERALLGRQTPADSCAFWQARGVSEVVVKCGSQGVAVGNGARLLQVPAQAGVPVVDTTGAGDSFNAAYLAARISGQSAEAAARAGNTLAAEVIQVGGAILPRERWPSAAKSLGLSRLVRVPPRIRKHD